MSILSQFTNEELENVIRDNPSLRGYLQGYLAEVALMKYLVTLEGVSSVTKIPDQHKDKGDIRVTYKDQKVTIEVKSIASNSVREDVLNDTWEGKVQIKNTDKRKVEVEGIGIISSSSIIKGQFDILAVSCYAVSGQWDFLYMGNEYLPEKSSELPGFIKTSFIINPETTPCVTNNLTKLLDSVIAKRSLSN